MSKTKKRPSWLTVNGKPLLDAPRLPIVDNLLHYVFHVVFESVSTMADVTIPTQLFHAIAEPLYPGEEEDAVHTNPHAVIGIVVDIEVAFLDHASLLHEHVVYTRIDFSEIVNSLSFDLLVVQDDFHHVLLRHNPFLHLSTCAKRYL